MKFKHVVRVRPAVIVVAAAGVLAAAASPAFAQVHGGVKPAVGDDSKSRGERIAGAARRTEQFRGRYQLRLSEARALLGG